MNAATFPAPAWLYYFNVSDIDAAGPAIVANGGTILRPAHEVPNGDWIIHARDSQGALFALTGQRT